MKNIDLQVGDRVTYKYKNDVHVEIIKNDYDKFGIKWLKDNEEKGNIKIKKIESQIYEIVYEEKGLLTQEEKEFLQGMLKYYKISTINFNDCDIDLWDKENTRIGYLNYPASLKFEGVERDKSYTLEELGWNNED